MFKKILVALDFSDNSAYVTEKSALLAAALGANIRLIHVQVLQAGDLEYDGGTASERERMNRQPGGELYYLETLANQVRSHGVTVDYVTASGNPADQILNAAKEYFADVIVLGSHGHGKLYHLLAGSTRENMLSQTFHPVLVFRKPVG